MTQELIAKLESASEGSRELNVALWNHFGGWAGVDHPPAVSTSTDAIMDAAERLLPDFTLTVVKYRTNIGEFKPHSLASFMCPYGEVREYRGDASTPALAICAALLRASAAEGVGHE